MAVDPAAVAVAEALPVVFTRSEALATGLTRHQVTRAPASGTWHRLAAGAYCPRDAWDAASADDRRRLTALGTWLRWPGTVISHTSAAALWGLPLPPVAWRGEGPWLRERTWLTAPPERGRAHRSGAETAVVVASLHPGDVELRTSPRYGRVVAVTSRARMVADCLRSLPAAVAVPLADAAGRTGLERGAVDEVLARQRSWTGADRARSALALVDPRRESWLESASAVGLVQRGLPVPEPQVEVCTPDGRFVARVDDWWPSAALVGEADGWAKYRTGGLTSADDAERALRREKQREDAVRALGTGFVRWTSSDVMSPRGMDRTAAAVRAALSRGDPARLRAVVRSTPLPCGW